MQPRIIFIVIKNKIKNNMKKAISISLFLSAFLFTISCDDDICLRGNNNVVIQERDLPSFNKIISEGSFDVYVEYGTRQSVEVEIDDNLLEYVKTEVSGSRLTISVRNNRCMRPDVKNVYISTPDIQSVSIHGSGSVRLDNVEKENMNLEIAGSGDIFADHLLTENLTVEIKGSGDVQLDGFATFAELKIDGSGDIDARDMSIDTCYADILGSGDMELRVNNYLDVVISGSGDIFYRGNPEIKSRINGSGDLQKRN
jgi:hypothetical protein